ncbi:fimbrial protein [Yersinia kristensenii]|uniref:fimbrial protein n=1 Tax=Yersinia kristensenii TaxID=28152 RepID=UPI001C60ABC5|nr:fimbrial protein [Yersinia kristensenii]MBW5816922.1 fimbrial protein [Yersinia kristensenii]MBW5842354.1 fimbrial protein [Yersinia kristensenii]
MKMNSFISRCSVAVVLALGSSWAYADNMLFSGTLINPPPCVINNTGTITVDFGNEVMTSRVDGAQYIQPVTYTLSCTGAISNALKMTIKGNGAGFDGNVLKTNNSDLGIKLVRNDQALALNTAFTFSYPTIPVLKAVPVKKAGSTLNAGDFYGTATMVVEYQ